MTLQEWVAKEYRNNYELLEAGVCSTAHVTSNEKTKKLFNTYIALLDAKCEVFETEEGQLSDTLRLMGYAMAKTYSRYNAIIGIYEANEGNLMKQIESGDKYRVNDTPQNGGEFYNDAHTNRFTETVHLTDGETPIARLKEIQDKIADYYGKWAHEFDIAFWEIR